MAVSRVVLFDDHLNGDVRLFRRSFPDLTIRLDPLSCREAPPRDYFKHDQVHSTRGPLRFFTRIRYQDLVARAVPSLEEIAAAQTRCRIDRDYDILRSPQCPWLRVRLRLEIRQLLRNLPRQGLLTFLVLRERRIPPLV